MAAASVRCLVKSLVSSHRVMVFSKSTCPFCMMAKDVLSEAGVPQPKVLELDHIEEGQQVQDALFELTGIRTVPNIFISGKCIGGGTDTARLYETGELQQLLTEAGVLKKQEDS
ncbi:PREDICTED: glutaredoxin-like [Branchiostoma belcheri]|uniref:Glutaredoxin-2, mitochondrial n=1 Tax=Branchiostoma belcheri TaxID=7741 RepID=A0A6P5AWF9_BRABE|nr:PREDICTED: glutaredoxin-like [Branchiostoma belcheri]KAI8495489.1 hypothetical protein Bbelb_269440 [Branchiostoma belcheri]